ncbi:winged helix-turn-helix domain-containing protein [Vibrio owensii]|uniref:winged helix-turn-helix domain-containing protein n=1 Tax=Vibrio owensii TaxID=696485 RepID=UPI0003A25CBE|nr:winged helix-turn-helix domain-containing protein [Vibrio owensii]
MNQCYIINESIRFNVCDNEIQHLESGLKFHLGTNESDLLKYFIANEGQLLSRHSLIQEIWVSKGVFVEDGSLMQAISMCRKALLDKQCKVIVTERGKGYRFNAVVSQMGGVNPTSAPRVVSFFSRRGMTYALGAFFISAVFSYFAFKSVPNLGDTLSQAAFSRCKVVFNGEVKYNFSHGMKYTVGGFVLLVDETGKSVSYPEGYQGVTCEE